MSDENGILWEQEEHENLIAQSKAHHYKILMLDANVANSMKDRQINYFCSCTPLPLGES